MTVFFSHRSERLLDFLATQLAADQTPLNEQWVLLPGSIHQQQLVVELVRKMPGKALAGVRFLGWREALYRVCSNQAHLPDWMEIQLRLARIFLNELPEDAKEDLASLTAWLEVGPSRTTTLVQSLSKPFVDALYYGFEGAAPWQKKLHDMMLADGSWSLPQQILKSAQLPKNVGQIHCFCIDEMPSIGWNFLLSHASLSIYLFSPCSMYWEDSVSDSERHYLLSHLRRKNFSAASLETFEGYLRDTHPLIANWGKMGRRLLNQLGAYSLQTVEAYEDAAADSLLRAVQEDMLLLRTAQETSFARKPEDASIQVVAAGSSRLREVEILKDYILRYLQKADATPSEILVLAPDIRPYESLIQFIFGSDLPIRIAPTAALPRNAYLQAWLLFFHLSDCDWAVDSVLELFENSAFQMKQHVTSEDLRWFAVWLKEAKIREHLQSGRGNWVEGLQRMIAGLVYLLPDENPLPRIDSIDWGQAKRLALFIHLIERLKQNWQPFADASHTLEEWVDLLTKTANDLFAINEDDESWRSCLRKLSMAFPCFAADHFPFSFIRPLIEEEFQSVTTSYLPLSIDAVQFSSLQPGAIHSAKAIFLLGMDSESFPAKELPSSLDWQSNKPKPEDRDRYLFLQALFSARELFYISYCHRSAHDGKSVESALPVQELMQTIDTYYPLNPPSSLLAVHPAFPYDAAYFQKESSFSSFSMNAFRAASLSSSAPSVFWPMDLPAVDERETVRQMDLADLLLLARHPWRYFLQRRLKVFLKEDTLFSELRKKDLVLEPYQELPLLRQMLQQPIEDVLAQSAHIFPAGVLGEWSKIQIRRKAADWKSHLEKWQISAEQIFLLRLSSESSALQQINSQRMDGPPLRLQIPGRGIVVEITGEADWLVPSGVLTTGEIDLPGLLRHWPIWLVLQNLFPKGTSIYSLKKGTVKTLESIDAADALARYVDYALHAEQSLSPLVFSWAELFLTGSFDEWKMEAGKSLMKDEDDLTMRWVLERSQPIPCERIWEEWQPEVQRTFRELIPESNHAII